MGDSTDSLVSSSTGCGASTPPLPPAVPRPPQARPAWTLPQSAAVCHNSVGFSVPGAIQISFCTLCAAISAATPKARLIWKPGQSVAELRQRWLVRSLSVPTPSDRSGAARMLQSCAGLTQRLSAALFGCATTPQSTFLLTFQPA